MNGTLRDEEMEDILRTEIFGHLGCCDAGIPYIFPMAFTYHQNSLYGQTKEGLKIAILRKNPHVCFQVQNLSGNVWHSVLCHGDFQELSLAALQEGDIESVRVLTKQLDAMQHQAGVSVGFSFEGTPEPLTIDGRTSTLWRIALTGKTGRFYVKDIDMLSDPGK